MIVEPVELFERIQQELEIARQDAERYKKRAEKAEGQLFCLLPGYEEL